jgi:hypothetical protein
MGFSAMPALGLLALVYLWRWRVNLREERVPASEKLLRPAGEGLRLRIGELDEKFTDTFFICLGAPPLAAAFLLLPGHDFHPLRLPAAIVAASVAFIVFARRLFGQAEELRNYRLGFHGERAAAEEINRLMLDGCRVFHDVPMEPYGNIDHVIVAPSGVYAVETKTRRKRKTKPGTQDYNVVFDGKALQFPHYADTESAAQARQQADRLRALLTKAVVEPVRVSPILTLPGWLVSSAVKDGMKVVNPKQIRDVVMSEKGPALGSQLIKRISHQLDQMCRDVAL